MTDRDLIYVYRRAFLTGVAMGAALGASLAIGFLSIAGWIR